MRERGAVRRAIGDNETAGRCKTARRGRRRCGRRCRQSAWHGMSGGSGGIRMICAESVGSAFWTATAADRNGRECVDEEGRRGGIQVLHWQANRTRDREKIVKIEREIERDPGQ